MSSTLIQELNNLKFQLTALKENKQKIADKVSSLEENLIQENDKLKFLLGTREHYKKAIDIIYERSIQELQDVLNSALAFIFDDRNYEVNITLSDKRGKSLSLRILDDGKPVNLRRGTAMGVKCSISAILHIYYLQCKNSKILMLDEAYSKISAQYTENFFTFLTQLCEKLLFRIIMITHDPRFLPYGIKTYTISKGKIVDTQ